MSLATVYTRAQVGIEAPPVIVETHLSNGLPSLTIVGLPETAVRESKERVRSALINSGFDFPTRRITINLAPADLPKQGGRYDLAIAISILVASGQIESSAIENHEFLGELSLTGDLRGITGTLPSTLAGKKQNKHIIVPEDSLKEALISRAENIYGADHLIQVCRHLTQDQRLSPAQSDQSETVFCPPVSPDLSEVKGQFMARKALEIAASGEHNLLFYGPPGTGKSMLASRLPSILPPLSIEQQIEVASIYSLVSSTYKFEPFYYPPFRSPHHSSSPISLVGGGSTPRPGEVSLAHRGVLFLDELPEFGRKALEVLREPIESGTIHISRANSRMAFPAKFQLLAAMNPCPCGFLGHPNIACNCTPLQIDQYRKKLSGPLLDRFDLHVEVAYQSVTLLLDEQNAAETSQDVYQRVKRTRIFQLERQQKLNNELNTNEISRFCKLTNSLRTNFEQTLDKLAISARGAHRILRVARTMADIDLSPNIEQHHLLQSIAFRGLDRGNRKQ